MFARVHRRPLACVLLLVVAGCSSKGSETTAGSTLTNPSPTPPTVTQFAGNWQGKWQHVGCTSMGTGFDWCNGIIIGDSSALSLSLVQNGSSVTGSMNYSGIVLAVEGTVGQDGVLSLAGPETSAGRSMSNWRSTLSGTRLDGTFTLNDLHFDASASKVGRVLSDRLLDVLKVN